MNPIALIAPYKRMAEKAREICEASKIPIVIEIGDLHEGLKKGRLLVERGVEVIISRGGTARLLKEKLPIPIVELKVTVYDILRAIRKVPVDSKKIGVIGFENIVYGLDKLSDLLPLDLPVFVIQKEEEVPIKLEEARNKKVDVIIGDKIVVSEASKIGQNSVLIESEEESILQSVHEAYEILEVVRAKKEAQYELERRVEERTAELAKANKQLRHEIAWRKRVEKELKESEEWAKRLAKENEIVAEIGRIIGSTLKIEEVYERFAEEARKLVSFDQIEITINNFEENTITVAYHSGVEMLRVEDVLPFVGSINAEVVSARASLLVQKENISELASRFNTLFPPFSIGFRSIMAVPLISKGQVFGVLQFQSIQPNAYTEMDLKLGERVGSQISGAIANSQLYSELKRSEEEQKRTILQLQDALNKIKILRGLLPICASCKRIRDDKGYWNQIEAYIRNHSEAEFSHGICPECLKKLYPDLYPDIDT